MRRRDRYAKALNFYKAKLLDPAFVFGKGKRNPDGHWSSRYQAEAVPLMQLLENGTVHNDPMPTPTVVRARQGVFNAEVVVTLVKFGFAPGANYGDTMHFDFIEGFNRAVPGGRSQENLKRTRFSPEGDLDRPMPTHNPESET